MAGVSPGIHGEPSSGLIVCRILSRRRARLGTERNIAMAMDICAGLPTLGGQSFKRRDENLCYSSIMNKDTDGYIIRPDPPIRG